MNRKVNTAITALMLLLGGLIAPTPSIAGGIVYTTENPGTTGGSVGKSLIPFVFTTVIGLPFATSGTTKGLQNESKKEDAFYARFMANQRAMRKDLLRMNGAHYEWVLTNISVSKEDRLRFRCQVSKKIKSLKRHLNAARSGKRSTVLAVRGFLKNQGRLAKDAMVFQSQCALYARYRSHPKRFRTQLTDSYSGADFEWTRTKYLSVRTPKRFQCALLERKKKLRQIFAKMAKQPLKHLEELHQELREVSTVRSESCRP